MTTTRRSILWPLIIIGVGAVWLLMTAGAFPEAVGDILLRAWPALLVLFGFDVLVGRHRLRITRWAVGLNMIGLIVTLILLFVVVWLAYDKQADTLRSDNVQTFAETVSEDVSQLRLDVAVRRAALTVIPTQDADRSLTAEFKGSNESDVEMLWSVEGATGVLTIRETARNSIPKLKDYGRGALTITLPSEIPLQEIALEGKAGDVTVDLLPLRVERFDLAMGAGDVVVSLPAQDTLVGTVKTEDGDLELRIPDHMALTMALQPGSGEPDYDYDTLKYDVLLDGTLKRRNADPFQIALDVWLKDNTVLRVVDLEAE